jgi:hypothetical protein
MKNKIQQKIYAIYQTLKAYASKLRISSFVGGQFKERHTQLVKTVNIPNGNVEYHYSDGSITTNYANGEQSHKFPPRTGAEWVKIGRKAQKRLNRDIFFLKLKRKIIQYLKLDFSKG